MQGLAELEFDAWPGKGLERCESENRWQSCNSWNSPSQPASESEPAWLSVHPITWDPSSLHKHPLNLAPIPILPTASETSPISGRR